MDIKKSLEEVRIRLAKAESEIAYGEKIKDFLDVISMIDTVEDGKVYMSFDNEEPFQVQSILDDIPDNVTDRNAVYACATHRDKPSDMCLIWARWLPYKEVHEGQRKFRNQIKSTQIMYGSGVTSQ